MNMTYREKIELNETIKRYEEIKEALKNVEDGTHTNGNKELNIRPCLPCQNNFDLVGCHKCFMKKAFGSCIDLGWGDLNDLIHDAITKTEDMLEKLRALNKSKKGA